MHTHRTPRAHGHRGRRIAKAETERRRRADGATVNAGFNAHGTTLNRTHRTSRVAARFRYKPRPTPKKAAVRCILNGLNSQIIMPRRYDDMRA